MSFPFKAEPSEIQLSAMKRAYKVTAFALYHAMGAGKTFTAINLAAARYLKGKIRHVIVIVNPSAIRDVWDVEVQKWCPVDYNVFVFGAGDGPRLERHGRVRDKTSLSFVVYGVEAFSQGNAIKSLEKYISDFEHEGIMMIIDEATSIKNPTATRTKKIIEQGKRCQYRLILTGTPITQGYHDLFSQMKFLDPDIIGCKSYVLFRNLYCIQGGFENRQIIGYQRIEELMQRIAPYCDIVSKEQAMPYLPPKQYLPDIVVKPTSQQRAAMDALKEQFAAEDSGHTLTVSSVMDRLTRYQQICGGFFPFDDVENGGYGIKRISGENPKLRALLADVAINVEQGIKTIIWARFVAEIELICEHLVELYGKKAVEHFYGATEDRKGATERFETDPEVLFMVSTQVVGGKGQTWVSSTQTRYYSQTFSYEDRMQSEDRNHRRGTVNTVGYRNIIMDVAADKMITAAITKKHDVAEEFKTGMKNIDLGA